MVLDEATHYLYGGDYERGIDFIDDNLADLTSNVGLMVELLLIKSRMYYHLGKIDKALYFSKQVVDQDNENPVGVILTIIYQYELGDERTARDRLENLQHWETREVRPQEISAQSWYYYALGLVLTGEGETAQAKIKFEKSLELRKQLDDAFEANIIHFQLAKLTRKLGDMEETKEHLEQSLHHSMKLGIQGTIATSATLLGTDLLMSGDYSEAIPFLEQGVGSWREQGSPFGIIWALGELAIVHYLSGDINKAIALYEGILPISEEIMPPLNLSNHYMNMFRFYLEGDQYKEATDMLAKLEGLEPLPLVKQRLALAQSLYKLRSDRLSDKLSQKSNLEKLEEVSDIDIKMRSLIAGVELLVNEYKVTSETLFKEKILEETDEKLEKLMHYIRLQNGITYEMHSALLRSKINILKYNPSVARQMLDSIIEEDNPVPIEIKRRIEGIEEDIENLEWSQTQFSFEKEFHSIPALKIFLYLLPRDLASFSEIQRGTSLSPGQLSGKTAKLEQLGYIIKHKKFVDQKMTTLFSLTVKGFKDFKSYMEELRVFIKI